MELDLLLHGAVLAEVGNNDFYTKIFKKFLTPLLKVFQLLNMLKKYINPPHLPHLLPRYMGRDSPEIIGIPQAA